MVRVDMTASLRVAKGMGPVTERNSVAIFLTEEAHTNELTVPDIMSAIMTPSTASYTLSWLLIPWVVKGFYGITSNLEGDCFIVW
jgi:hypothetical protein